METPSALESPSAITLIPATKAGLITRIPTPLGEGGGSTPLTNEYSIDLNGSTQYMTADGLETDVASDTIGTWIAWVAPTNATPSNSETIISFGDTDANTFIELTLSGITETLLTASCRVSGTNQWVLRTTDLGWANDAWHMVAVVHNGTDATLYVNGLDSGATYTVSTDKTIWNNGIAGLDNFTVGARRTSSTVSQHWDGLIDEASVYSSDLSAAQITAIYNSGVPIDLSGYSPKGWYRMGDNDGGTGSTITNQGSASSSDGTLVASPTFSTDVPVYVFNKYSVDFDDSDDYIDLTAFNPSTQIGSGDITISVWVKLDSIADNDTVVSLTYYNAFAEKSIKIQFITGVGFRVAFANSGAFTNIYSTATIAADTWYHIIATRSGTTGNIWVNNADNGTTTHANVGTDLADATWHALGLYHAASTPNMGGLIHDYAIFDRVISSDERAELYNNGVSIDAREVTGADPVAYYPLNEGTGTVATDLISANNGTLTNGPTWSSDVPT